ncbi:MAG: heterodisulfide reductase-related iron-sulfur binding cluster [Bryobacteraceae bacterium]|nr:heterodisulfide reductase-related iron-sulfur binding cluster [Bryobacteraceae bacterium]MDW8379960.1 heterodisulfide reductase-related iron-sulfur binding cluster [Bryobacterales bacterium]
MAVSELTVYTELDKPQQRDLDRCVHCGLCLNACPTYRVLGLEMDSPRGRIYQMVQVAEGAPITPSYVEHLELCLACRGCETACPSGVQYGRLIEAARAEIEARLKRPWAVRTLRRFVFSTLLPSPGWLKLAARLFWLYERSGLQRLVRSTGLLRLFGKLQHLEQLAPRAEFPTFFDAYGKVFPAEGTRRYKVALLGGCIANVSFARLHEATVRVLQKNGCEVHVPAHQTCCGALQLHSGVRSVARRLARQNVDALAGAGFDAILTNSAGCGSTLKEYGELLEHEEAYCDKARQFVEKVRDVNEFLASLELNPNMRPLNLTVTYQDSCHLAHGQKIKAAPRKLLRSIPGLRFQEMPLADLCCGSAGIYNVLQTEMSMEILTRKMECVNATSAQVIATANTGCMLQLRAGVALQGRGQRVAHVVELLDEAYR